LQTNDHLSIESFIDDIKKVLSLQDEKIIIKESPYTYNAELDWNKDSRCWEIHLKIPVEDKFPIIHEVGHIYLAKKTSCLQFARPPHIGSPSITDLLPLINNLLDDFVNYNISQFKPLYPYYRLTMLKFLGNTFIINIKNFTDSILLITYYFLLFVDFNFILRERDRNKYQNKISRVLNTLEKLIIRLSENTDLKGIKDELIKFQQIRVTNDKKDIFNFFVIVLASIGIWEKSSITQQIENLFL